MRLYKIGIVVLLLFSLVGCTPSAGVSISAPESMVPVLTPEALPTESDEIVVLTDGGNPYVFSNSPIYDGNILWLPGIEIMKMADGVRITVDEHSLSCNYIDDQGQEKNCIYRIGDPLYSVDTSLDTFLEAESAPYTKNGEVFISEGAIETLTGDVFRYDPASNTVVISLGNITLQSKNQNAFAKIEIKKPSELNDNRISGLLSGLSSSSDKELNAMIQWVDTMTPWSWVSVAINNQDWAYDNWAVPDFYSSDKIEEYYKTLDDNGIRITYNLIFKDKEYLGESNQEGNGSLHDPEQVERYLEFIEQVVTHFKGIVDCYEIWNEPNIGNSPQYVDPDDYIEFVKKAYPFIKRIDPDAIVSIGHTTSYYEEYSQDYIDRLVSSDVVQYADRITLHSFFWISPTYYPEYYYGYPDIVTAMMDKARSNGFQGDFWGSEGNYMPMESVAPEEAYMMTAYPPILSAKYVQRVNAMNLGLGLSGGEMGVGAWPECYNPLARSATLFSGVKAASYGIEINTDIEPINSYSYDVDSGKMFAYWDDRAASEGEQISWCDITLDLPSCEHIYAYDVMTGYDTEVDYSMKDGKIVIEGMAIKDYPIFLVVQ